MLLLCWYTSAAILVHNVNLPLVQAVKAELEHLHDVEAQLQLIQPDEQGAVAAVKGVQVILPVSTASAQML